MYICSVLQVNSLKREYPDLLARLDSMKQELHESRQQLRELQQLRESQQSNALK